MNKVILLIFLTFGVPCVVSYGCDYNLPYRGLSCDMDLSFFNLNKNLREWFANEKEKFAAITFDDGPSDTKIKNIMEGLKNFGANATFFLAGEHINSKTSGMVKELIKSGHELGSHSWSHKNMTELTLEEQLQDMEQTNRVIKAVTKEDLKWFRPPFGCQDKNVIKNTHKLKMNSILWTIDSEDYKGVDADTIVGKVLAEIHNGAIILLHDLEWEHFKTFEAVPHIANIMTQLGYELVTLSEWERRVCNVINNRRKSSKMEL